MSSSNKSILAPVPVVRGGNICLYPDKSISGSQWDVFNLMGESQASLSFSSGYNECWDTSNVGPGVYAVRVKENYTDGTSATFWQKVLVTP